MSSATAFPSIAAAGPEITIVSAGHIERAFRCLQRGPGVTGEQGFFRLVTGEPHPFGNFALISDAADPAAVEAAMEPLVRCGAPAALLFTGAIAGDVPERLKRAGFEPHGGMPAMAVNIVSLAATTLPEGCSFTTVGRGRDSDEWAEAFSVGYELPRRVAEPFAPNAVRANAAAHYFAIRKGGRIVCTSMLFLDNGVAGIYCVATLPEERAYPSAAWIAPCSCRTRMWRIDSWWKSAS